MTPTHRLSGRQMAGITAIVSGVAIYVNSFGIAAWRTAGNPTTYTTAKNIVAAIGLAAMIPLARPRPTGTKRRWGGLAAVAVIGGSVPFVLFFEGLAQATSAQAALLHKSLVIWVAVLAVPFLHERLRASHVAAIGLLVAGQLWLSGGTPDLAFGRGEWLILAATLLWSVEVILDKRLLADQRPADVAVARMAGGAALLIGYGFVSGATVPWAALTLEQWGWIALTGGTLAAYVATWLAALQRAPAVDVTAVLVFGAVITLVLAQGVTVLTPAIWPGMVLITVGAGWFLRRPSPAT